LALLSLALRVVWGSWEGGAVFVKLGQNIVYMRTWYMENGREGGGDGREMGGEEILVYFAFLLFFFSCW